MMNHIKTTERLWLPKLERLRDEFKSTKNFRTKQEIGIKCGELCIPIVEYYYPKNKTPRLSLEKAKAQLKNIDYNHLKNIMGKAGIDAIGDIGDIKHNVFIAHKRTPLRAIEGTETFIRKRCK